VLAWSPARGRSGMLACVDRKVSGPKADGSVWNVEGDRQGAKCQQWKMLCPVISGTIVRDSVYWEPVMILLASKSFTVGLHNVIEINSRSFGCHVNSGSSGCNKRALLNGAVIVIIMSV
jgi:hypothetical protein